MPNPKRRHSHARTRKRRAHHHLVPQSGALCPNCAGYKMPHRPCRSCGYYKDREVIEVDSE